MDIAVPSTTVTPMTARSAEEAALIASVSLRQRKNSGTDLAIGGNSRENGGD